MPGTSSRMATRSWTSGANRVKTSASKASAGHGARSPVNQGPHASTKAWVVRARTYSPFRWVSLATSKKAGEWLTSSSRNHSII